MSISDFSPARNRWVRLILDRFHDSHLPSLLAYGVAGLSVTLGLIIYGSTPEELLAAGYGPLLVGLSLRWWSLGLIMVGGCMAAFYNHSWFGAVAPAGLLCGMYSFMAMSAGLAGVGWWSGLFVLMLFAGYASALLVLTPVGRTDD